MAGRSPPLRLPALLECLLPPPPFLAGRGLQASVTAKIRCHPVRAAARSAAAQTRDSSGVKGRGGHPSPRMGPGSAVQHFVLHCVRDDIKELASGRAAIEYGDMIIRFGPTPLKADQRCDGSRHAAKAPRDAASHSREAQFKFWHAPAAQKLPASSWRIGGLA